MIKIKGKNEYGKRQAGERFQTSLREHLLTFNDGVISIITIMVLSIPAPRSDGDFWYDAHRIFITFKRAMKQVVIADFFLLTLSFIPVMTKWIIIDPSQMALAVYGGVYLLVQMCAFWIFVAGNYCRVHKGAVWQTALVRTLLIGMPLAVVLILLPKITLIMYLVLPIIRSSHLIEHLDDIIIKSKTPDFLSGVLCRV